MISTSCILRGESQLSLTESLECVGLDWICLALPSNDSGNPNFYPPLLLPHLRDPAIACEVGDPGSTSPPDHLPRGLLHLTILHLPPPAHGLAPTGKATVLQRLVLLPRPSCLVQHKHGLRRFPSNSPPLSSLEAPNARQEALERRFHFHAWSSVGSTASKHRESSDTECFLAQVCARRTS